MFVIDTATKKELLAGPAAHQGRSRSSTTTAQADDATRRMPLMPSDLAAPTTRVAT
ncbi:MAG: hypothetical protein IPJ34_27855 [Myxococcales bacterium]|nr:hypothetical protein [Myxococcales bacterium]